MKRFLALLVSLAVPAFALLSCSEDSTTAPSPQPSGLLSIGKASDAGLTVELLAAKEPATGYNPLYAKVTDASGRVLRRARLTLTPLMDMGTKIHAAPVEQPAGLSGDVFPAAVVFTMPGGDAGSWTIRADVYDSADGTGAQIAVPVQVGESGRTSVVTGTDGDTYIVTMACMCGAAVGMNDIEFLVHRKQDMMTFPPVEDLTLVMTPDMPSMGHGSPNNADPTHRDNGHYEGRVNFTMTGEWRIRLELKRGDATVAQTSFTVVL